MLKVVGQPSEISWSLSYCHYCISYSANSMQKEEKKDYKNKRCFYKTIFLMNPS